MRPVTFDNCFGTFHPGWSRKGVVLCNSFGLENLRYLPALSYLAEVLSGRGINVLHFDYSGTGDSGGTTLDPDILDRWIRNTQMAESWLRQHGNVETVSYAGLRLGAIIAALAASETDLRDAGGGKTRALDELILLPPPASGSTFVAEMVHAARVLGQNPCEQTPENKLPFDGVDIGGYRLGKQTLAELENFNWENVRRCEAGHVQILAENRIEDRKSIISAFKHVGCKVEIHDGVAGFERAMSDMRAARREAPHWDAIARMVSVPAGVPGVLPKTAAVFPLVGPGFLETPVFLDGSQEYSDIFCQGNGGQESRMAVLFLPSAQGHALSWPRLLVDWSRRFARNGIASLRLSQRPAESLKQGTRLEDAISWLKARRYTHITLVAGTATDRVSIGIAASDAGIKQMLVLDSPPLPLGFGRAKAATRSDDLSGREANENDLAGSMPDRMRSMRHSLDAIQRLKDFALDKQDVSEPLQETIKTFSNSGKPLALMYCSGAELSRALAGFDGSLQTGNSRAANLTQQQSLSNVHVIAVDSPNGCLAGDSARNSAGDRVMAFLQKPLAGESDRYRLAFQPV